MLEAFLIACIVGGIFSFVIWFLHHLDQLKKKEESNPIKNPSLREYLRGKKKRKDK